MSVDASLAAGPDSPTGLDDPPATAQSRTRRSLLSNELLQSSVTAIACFAVFVVYAIWLGGDFVAVGPRMYDLAHSAPQLVLACGLVVCLACHHFDLSAAAMASLACFLTIGLHLKSDLPIGLSIVVALAVGAAGGLVNGLLVTKVGLNAFIATLGTGAVWTGLTTVYSSGQVVGPNAVTGMLPRWFSGPGSMGDFQNKVPAVVAWLALGVVVAALGVSIDQRFFRPGRWTAARAAAPAGCVALLLLAALSGITAAISWMIVVLIGVATVIWVVLKYTHAGRALYAVGGNEKAARFAGIHTERVTIAAFVLAGFVSALAGVMLAAVQGSAVPGIAEPLLLPSYAALFLSTVLISRGRFHIWGTVAGGLFLVYVTSGLVEGGVKFTWTQVIHGLVLVLTVAISTLLRKR